MAWHTEKCRAIPVKQHLSLRRCVVGERPNSSYTGKAVDLRNAAMTRVHLVAGYFRIHASIRSRLMDQYGFSEFRLRLLVFKRESEGGSQPSREVGYWRR
jgi:hypothetical protein